MKRYSTAVAPLADSSSRWMIQSVSGFADRHFAFIWLLIMLLAGPSFGIHPGEGVVAKTGPDSVSIAGFDTPGSPSYPNGGLREAAPYLNGKESNFTFALPDPANGRIYFVSGGTSTNFVKYAMRDGGVPPTRIGAANFSVPSTVRSAVIDTAAGYAYLGSNSNPGVIYKVRLGAANEAPALVGTLTLQSGENRLRAAVIDPAGGHAYFGTRTIPGMVIKVALGAGDTLPTRVEALTLPADEVNLSCGLIDAAAEFAYFGTETTPGKVIKVNLTNPGGMLRVAALVLDADEGSLQIASYDPVAEQGLFGAVGIAPGRIIKVDLGAPADPPTRVGTLVLNTGEDTISGAYMDALARTATYTIPSRKVVKVNLGAAMDPPSRVGTLTLSSPDSTPLSAALDPVRGVAYVGDLAGRVIELDPGTPGSAPTRIGSVEPNANETSVKIALIDPLHKYGYLVANRKTIVKLELGELDAAPVRLGAVAITTASIVSGAIDPVQGYAYFGTDETPGRVLKYALGSGQELPSFIGSLTLDPGEDDLRSCCIDSGAGYGYFVSNTSPAKVVKVALETGATTPTRVGSLALDPGEDGSSVALIDPAAGTALIAAGNRVTKIGLGVGAAPPFRVGSAILSAGEFAQTGVIDTTTGNAYFTGNISPGTVVKVKSGAPTDPPTRLGSTQFAVINYLNADAIDPDNGFAYFANDDSPGKLLKMNLGAGDALPAYNALLASSSFNHFQSGFMDSDDGYVYFGSGDFMKIATSQKDCIRANKVTLSETGAVIDFSFYSHKAKGNARLAIYDDMAPRNLLWESPPTSNTVENGWLTIPISAGTPSALSLSPGSYWLAWQIDTTADVPSYTMGPLAEEFFLVRRFGPAPAQIDATPISASGVWSAYINYDSVEATPSPSPSSSPSVSPSPSSSPSPPVSSAKDWRSYE